MPGCSILNQVVSFVVLAVFLGDSVSAGERRQENQEDPSKAKVSKFGQYAGYSKKKFDKWVLHSQYVAMRDGVKLAVDIVRPSTDGKKPADERLPVIWTHSRYHRNQQAMAPHLKSFVDGRPDLQRLVKHGYAIVTVGVRGSGASFGRFEGLMSPNETKDSYEIIDWISKQDWCDGNVGMFGGSYLGMTQYMAASQGHPALKAIFPNVAGFDLYDVMYPGGVFREDMIRHWDTLTRMLDNELNAAKVQSDSSGEMLAKAVDGHRENWEVLKEYRNAKYRNTVSPEHSYQIQNLSPFLESINRARVPAYHWNGFLDIFVTDATIWFANYAGPQKMGIGPWSHGAVSGQPYMKERIKLQTVEQHRWFDFWLKGIENGIMDEPPIHYSVLDEAKKWSWKTAETWPPASVTETRYYFSSGKSGSIESNNDGRLQRVHPLDGDPADKYEVDLTTTTGKSSRWDNAVGQGALRYGDLTSNDRKSLTFTTEPLKKSLAITGHPVATIFVSCSAPDCDFFVLLEEVDANGKSNYVTEGVLRASQRNLADAPWNNLGLPFQRCFKEDISPLVRGKVAELKLDLHPTSIVFNAKHRIRVTVMCADKDNAEQLKSSDGATVLLHHDPDHLSHIILPTRMHSE